MPPEPMDKPTERAPMLSDEGLGEMFSADGDRDYQEDQQWFGGKCVRDFYEAKITSGELRVVNKVVLAYKQGEYGHCSGCHRYVHNVREPLEPNFCSGCGAQIVKG